MRAILYMRSCGCEGLHVGGHVVVKVFMLEVMWLSKPSCWRSCGCESLHVGGHVVVKAFMLEVM